MGIGIGGISHVANRVASHGLRVTAGDAGGANLMTLVAGAAASGAVGFGAASLLRGGLAGGAPAPAGPAADAKAGASMPGVPERGQPPREEAPRGAEPPKPEPGISRLSPPDPAEERSERLAVAQWHVGVSETGSRSDWIDTYWKASGTVPTAANEGLWGGAFISWVFEHRGTTIADGGSPSFRAIAAWAGEQDSWASGAEMQQALASGAVRPEDLAGQMVVTDGRRGQGSLSVGIVDSYDPDTGTVTAIHGNVGDAVARVTHQIGEVTGFADPPGAPRPAEGRWAPHFPEPSREGEFDTPAAG